MDEKGTPEEENRVSNAVGRMLRWLILIVGAGALAYLAFGWLGTIPSWAAVFIILLILQMTN